MVNMKKSNRAYNDNNVYVKDSTWFLYKDENFWILSNSQSPLDVDSLKESNYTWTTTNSDRIDSDLNGNYGSSSEFVGDRGVVEVVCKTLITPSPTPTPVATPTPSKTPTPTPSGPPETPMPLLTPTPVEVEPTPTSELAPTPTPTPTEQVVESPFLFEFGDFAITRNAYDLSKDNPEVVENKIKEDLFERNYVASGIATIEDLIIDNSILAKIPTEIKRFTVKVRDYEKLANDGITPESLTSYTWDTEGLTTHAVVRSFYLTKVGGGRVHKYGTQYQFAEYGYYIKSWLGARPVLVKLENQVDVVSNPTASTGLYNGILIKWIPSPNAKHIRIERNTTSGWEIRCGWGISSIFDKWIFR